eukprot:1144703-Pelagomonas_calceolata.AAC.4
MKCYSVPDACPHPNAHRVVNPNVLTDLLATHARRVPTILPVAPRHCCCWSRGMTDAWGIGAAMCCLEVQQKGLGQIDLERASGAALVKEHME